MKIPGLAVVRSDLLFVCLVVALAVPSGLGLNLLRSNPLPLRPDSPEERLLRGVVDLPRGQAGQTPKLASLDEAMAAFDQNAVVFVDAREDAFFDLGRIPEAWNLSRQNFQAAFPAFSMAVGREQALMVYCSEEDCEDSMTVAKALLLLGYSDVTVFGGGWSEWEAAGQPREP